MSFLSALTGSGLALIDPVAGKSSLVLGSVGLADAGGISAYTIDKLFPISNLITFAASV